MIKRFLSVVLTAAMMSAIFGADALVSVTALAADATAEPEVTVVGKRITNDNTYFEISLEVNGDYEDYTSVGVVLKYDPSLIIPAESWDDDAAAADMTASTSWATRRALPTLGKDTWSSHTALTYIETDESGTSAGYLYLGAEYPGTLPATPMPTESADATDAPADEPTTAPASTPEATTDPDADPHTNPVVVARFMYASETAKDTIEEKWTSDWDADWQQNTILTIADSTVADESPAQYSFAYYYSDYSMKAYHTDYTATVLDTSEQAAATDIEVVLGEGDSAKSSGLSLSDVSVVLFYDWDDSLLGSITLAKGTDSGEAVNDYIEEEFIHPDLQDNTNYESTARADNYRGEYPYDGPSSSNPTVPDGSANTRDNGGDYPLTNKLEYCFAGRSFYEGLPFIGGWTEVTPETMEDTWTALSSTDKFGVQADVDEDGVLDTDADGNPLDADSNILDMTAFDFSSIPSGITYVKAVYTPGEWLDGGGSTLYTADNSVSYTVVGDVATGSTTIGITFIYGRINSSGYGVTRIRQPRVRMDIIQTGASGSTSFSINVDNTEKIEVELTPSQQVDSVGYQLIETWESDIISGAKESLDDALGIFYLNPTDDDDGFLFKGLSNYLLELAYENLDNPTGTSWADNTLLKLIPLYRTTTGSSYTNATFAKKAREPLCNLVSEYIASTGVDGVPEGITWYQLQYAVLQTSSPYYVSDDVAKAYVESYPKLTR